MTTDLAAKVGVTFGAGEPINALVGAPSANCFSLNNLQLFGF